MKATRKTLIRVLATVFVLTLVLGATALFGSAEGVTYGSAVIRDSFNAYAGDVLHKNGDVYTGWQSANGKGTVTFDPAIEMQTEGYAYYYDLEYYYDAQSGGTIEVRLRNDWRASSADRRALCYITNGTLQVNKEGGINFIAEGAETGAVESVPLGAYGWHHIRVKLEQDAVSRFDVESGVNVLDYTFTLTYYVDGVEWKSFNTVEGFFEGCHYYLYCATVDPDSGAISYKSVRELKELQKTTIPALEEELSALTEGSAAYTAKQAEIDLAKATLAAYGYGATAPAKTDSTEPYIYATEIFGQASREAIHQRVRNVKVSWGSQPISTVSPVKYNLNGGALPTTAPVVEPTSNVPSADYTWTGYEGATYVFTEVDHFHVEGTGAPSLVTPFKSGAPFLGWYTDEAMTVEYDPASYTGGGVTVYAKYADPGLYRLTVDMLDGSEPTVLYPSGETFVVEEGAMLWIASDGKTYLPGETLTLTKDTALFPLTLELLSGASVRLNADRAGLRFESRLSTASLSALDACGIEDYAIGTLILPTDLLKGNFTVAALAEGSYLDLNTAMNGVALKHDPDDGYTYFYAAIVDIMGQNYTRAFSAVSYIKINGEYFYTDYSAEENSRSIWEVAAAAYMDGDAEYSETESAIITAYLDKVVVLNAVFEIVESVYGYVSPYSVSYADGSLSITAKDGTLADGDISTVIYNYVTYTGGWTVADNKLTAPYSILYAYDLNDIVFAEKNALDTSQKQLKMMTSSNLFGFAVNTGVNSDVTYTSADQNGNPLGYFVMKENKHDQYPQIILYTTSADKLSNSMKTNNAITVSMSVKIPEGATKIATETFRLRGPDIAAADTRDGETKIASNKNIIPVFKFSGTGVYLNDGTLVANVTDEEFVDITVTIDLERNIVYGYCNGELTATMKDGLKLHANYPYKDKEAQTEYTLHEWALRCTNTWLIEGSGTKNTSDTTVRGVCIDNVMARIHNITTD